MANKGLCITCDYDKTCTFSRRFPVLQCEEFSGNGLAAKSGHIRVSRCSVRTKAKSRVQEETIAE